MTPRLAFARRMARKYLRKHRVLAPPVPVEYILFLEEVRVERLDYPDATAGESWREGETARIAVARSLPPGRLRFTLAHEFGHLALCHHENPVQDLSFLTARRPEPDGDPWERFDPVEAEANAFAGELLLPEYLFRTDWEKQPEPGRLARKYEVSEAAVRWRAQSLRPVRV